MKIKLCGFTDKALAKFAAEQKCDFLGFIFYQKSPRFITPKKAKEICINLPRSVARVGVVVDASFDELKEIVEIFAPDFLQFHGDEQPEFLQNFRKNFPQTKIIKAFKVASGKDLEAVANFENCADLFLFDGKNPGSGKSFDWKILENFSCKKDWFLSGGLNITNIDEATKITGAQMVDISSGIEEVRGKKSPKLIGELMEKLGVRR